MQGVSALPQPLSTTQRDLGVAHVPVDGAMLEDEAGAWEDAGGLGLRVPYWNPVSYQSGNWSPSYILVTPEGKVTGPDFDEVTIPHWEETAAIIKTGLSALLVIWFAGAMFRLVVGGGEE